MLFAVLSGLLATSAVAVGALILRRAPTRVRCPECSGTTQLLLLPPVLRRNGLVHLRWCPACGWEGLGRTGPEWVPGRRLAHDSGFHWGSARFQPDFGFRFRRWEDETRPPPHHPSGFHFAGKPEEAPQPRDPAHPSGFRFRATPGHLSDVPAPPLVFRWAPQVTPRSFRFAPRRGRRRTPGGFHWKGVA